MEKLIGTVVTVPKEIYKIEKITFQRWYKMYFCDIITQ